MINILLTGASGYIGKHLLDELLDNDQYSVSILIRPTTDSEFINDYKKSVKVYEYTDFESLNNVFQVEEFDLIIHLAGYVGSGMTYDEVDKNIKGNLVLAAHLLEAMRLNGVSKIVNTGSYWEFGDREKFVPKTIYAIYKSAVRNLLSEYIASYGFNAINLILYDVYGEDDSRRKIIPTLIGAGENEKIKMTPGFQKLNFVHIHDVVDGYRKSIQSLINNDQDFLNNTFHLRTDKSITLRQLVNKVQIISGRKIDIEWGGKSYSKFQIMQPNLEGATLPEWKALITIDEGLRKIIYKQSN